MKRNQLRSKQPDLVRQELWGTLLAYNLIRQEMRLMAGEMKVAPQRFCPLETPGTIPKRLAELRIQAQHFMLPARRSRSYPRVVRPRPVKYPKKKAGELN